MRSGLRVVLSGAFLTAGGLKLLDVFVGRPPPWWALGAMALELVVGFAVAGGERVGSRSVVAALVLACLLAVGAAARWAVGAHDSCHCLGRRVPRSASREVLLSWARVLVAGWLLLLVRDDPRGARG